MFDILVAVKWRAMEIEHGLGRAISNKLINSKPPVHLYKETSIICKLKRIKRKN